MQESDLYPPLKQFLESQNYDVKGEILDCDVVAVRGTEAPLIIELKLSLNLSVILQAVDRLSLSPTVYVGVPKTITVLKKRRKSVLKLFRRLGLGLIAIDPTLNVGSVEALLDPGEPHPRIVKKRQQRLLREFMQRTGDPNLGGSDRRKGLMTAYRQRALNIGQYLLQKGPTKAALVAKALEEPKAREILYRNVYGWFERPSTGVYALSSQGKEEISQWLAPPTPTQSSPAASR